MDFDDYETIYALGLDEVVTGERQPTDEERALLAGIGATNAEAGSDLDLFALLLSLFR